MNILIFRTDRIGDLILTCPTIITIKKYFEKSHITLISSYKNHSYAKSLSIFDEIYQFPKNSLLKKIDFINTLSKKKFDYIFVLDGKERSIITSKFIKANYKIALTKEKKFYYRYIDINLIIDNESKKINEIFQEMIDRCKINTKIRHYNFLKDEKDNKFSSFIPINKYIHIHLDEKWFNNSYIDSYTDINPHYDEFVDFLNSVLEKENILITTGKKNLILIDDLKKKYFKEISENIYINESLNKVAYLVKNTSFNDLQSLLRNSKVLISCHGAITHAANSFDNMKIDIFEKSKEIFYRKYTSYLNHYSFIYREQFSSIKKNLYNKIISYEKNT